MQNTLTSNLKVTTLWPELTNQRIQAIDSQLEEVRFVTREKILTVSGVIRRKVVCFDGRYGCHKVEDRLQFAVNLTLDESPEEGRLENLSLSDLELRQNYFVFQPGSGGNPKGILEQSFTLAIRYPPVGSVPRKTALPVWAKVITGNGQESVVMDLPVSMLGSSLTPRSFTGAIHIHTPVSPPVISGVLKGIITYRDHHRQLKEMDFETAIHFLPDRPPPLQANQQLWVTGELAGFKWRVAKKGGWALEVKIHYQWRVMEERELWIATEAPGRDPGARDFQNYAVKTRLKKFEYQVFKSFPLTGVGFEPGEIKVRMGELQETLTPLGLLLSGNLIVEAYGIGESGLEIFQERRVSFDELLAREAALPRKGASEWLKPHVIPAVRLLDFYYVKGALTVEVSLEFLIRLYREQVVRIPQSGSSGVKIIASLIGEKQEFVLERKSTLILPVPPRQVLKLKARVLRADSEANSGWLGIDGRMEVGVCFLDQFSHYCEITFEPLFQGAFNWDKLQPRDMVRLQCRLKHYTYTWNERTVLCRYWLGFTLENRREVEIPVEITTPEYKPEDGNRKEFTQPSARLNRTFPKTLAVMDPVGRLGLPVPVNTYLPSGVAWRFIMVGEIPLKIGMALESGNNNLRLNRANCSRVREGFIIEGVIGGNIEYWDQAGFLRQETVEASFWRLSRNFRGILFNDHNLQLELGEVKVNPVLPPSRGKGKVRVTFELIVKI